MPETTVGTVQFQYIHGLGAPDGRDSGLGHEPKGWMESAAHGFAPHGSQVRQTGAGVPPERTGPTLLSPPVVPRLARVSRVIGGRDAKTARRRS